MKRRQHQSQSSHSHSNSQSQSQNIFSLTGSTPMTIENARQSFQYLLDRGRLNTQLSLRETARYDICNQNYNIFKEWAPISDIKLLLQDMFDYRSDILERLLSFLFLFFFLLLL